MVVMGRCRITATEVEAGTVVSVCCEGELGCSGLSQRDTAAGWPRDDDRRVSVARGDVSQDVWVAGGDMTRAFEPVPCRRGWLARQLAHQQQELLGRPETAPALVYRLLGALARSPEPSVRIDVARHVACPPDVLAALSTDWWWEVRAGVAANPTCPTGLARQLATDPSTWVRRAVAENEHVEPAVLDILAADSDFGVRDAVAEHPRCPAYLLEGFCHDAAWEIRRSVAKRPDAPATALRDLAGDSEHWVRFFVACNPATDDATRRLLEDDPRPSVRAMARKIGTRGRAVAMYLALDGRGSQARREDGAHG